MHTARIVGVVFLTGLNHTTWFQLLIFKQVKAQVAVPQLNLISRVYSKIRCTKLNVTVIHCQFH